MGTQERVKKAKDWDWNRLRKTKEIEGLVVYLKGATQEHQKEAFMGLNSTL